MHFNSFLNLMLLSLLGCIASFQLAVRTVCLWLLERCRVAVAAFHDCEVVTGGTWVRQRSCRGWQSSAQIGVRVCLFACWECSSFHRKRKPWCAQVAGMPGASWGAHEKQQHQQQLLLGSMYSIVLLPAGIPGLVHTLAGCTLSRALAPSLVQF